MVLGTTRFTSSVSAASTTIKGTAGTDKISLYGASDVVFDVSTGDSIFGGTGADTMLFTGSVVSTSLFAGSGADSIVMSGDSMSSDYIDLGSGVDTLKFTKASINDSVIVATTISGAKSITYEKAVTSAVITTAAGADVVIFEDALSGTGTISTHSGNDSIQFLKSAGLSIADLGAGSDSVYGADVISTGSISGGAGADTFLISTLSNAAIYGGTGKDSINITGSLYGATVDFGASNENSLSLLDPLRLRSLVLMATTPLSLLHLTYLQTPPLVAVPVTTR